MTSGFSSTVIIVTLASILGGSGIWMKYFWRSTPTRMPSSMSVGATWAGGEGRAGACEECRRVSVKGTEADRYADIAGYVALCAALRWGGVAPPRATGSGAAHPPGSSWETPPTHCPRINPPTHIGRPVPTQHPSTHLVAEAHHKLGNLLDVDHVLGVVSVGRNDLGAARDLRRGGGGDTAAAATQQRRRRGRAAVLWM